MNASHRAIPWAAGLALIACACAAQAASSVKVGTAALISTATANDPLLGGYANSVTSTKVLWLAGRPNELVELKRALEGDPDKIYDFVRNNVETIWMYGLQKGAMGALIDRRGTAFDQVHLMAELLRESGFTVHYLAGTIEPTPTEFYNWTRVSGAKAACQLLSSGGIPAVINGLTKPDCDYGAANLTSIRLSHIWLSVAIPGSPCGNACLFDPSFKPHTFKTGVNLASIAGMNPGDTLAAVGDGSPDDDSGVNYIRNLNVESMNGLLGDYAENIRAHILSTFPAGEIEDLVGGSAIVRFDPPSPLRQASLPYSSSAVQRTWTGGIPDQYRTTLGVQITKLRPPPNTPSVQTIISKAFWVDEIYGRKLIFDTNFTDANFVGSLRVLDEFGAGPTFPTTPTPNFADPPNYSQGTLTLMANHPYVASADGSSSTNKDYMDREVAKSVIYATPLIILHGWGDADRRLVDKWGTRLDKIVPPLPPDGCDNCSSGYFMSAGDGRREQLAASWLAQSSVAARLHAEIADAVYTHHHSLGVVGGDAEISLLNFNPPGTEPDEHSALIENFDRIDVDSSVSVTSLTADANARSKTIRAIAATIEALEGSVAAQIADLPDTNSTATRFAWGNRPPNDSTNPSAYGPRKFYDFNAGNSSQVLSLALVEGLPSTSNDGVHGGSDPEIGSIEFGDRKAALRTAVQAYTNDAFSVVASGEAFLGPGQRGGAFIADAIPTQFVHRYSEQRGGALVANKHSITTGEPVEIAHVVVGPGGGSKGGGGGAQPTHEAMYDPSKAADILKTRFVDRSQLLGVDPRTGDVTHTSPASLTVGNGGFPYALTASLIWRSGDIRSERFGPISHVEPSVPWTTNWNNTLTVSGSGLEMMGDGDIRAVGGTVAAFLAIQDIYSVALPTLPTMKQEVTGILATAWWAQQLSGNVVTVNVGTDTRQFIRDVANPVENIWFLPGPGRFAELTQSGSRSVYVEPNCKLGAVPSYVLTRGWDYSTVSFDVKNAEGDIQHFAHWKKKFADPTGNFCANQRGFRLTQWTFPYGMTVNLLYGSQQPTELDELLEVNNSIGRRITFVDSGRGGFTNGLTGGDLRSVSVSTGLPGPTITTTHTEPSGAQTKFVHKVAGGRHLLDDMYAADNASVAALHFDYDTLKRAKEVKDAVAIQGGIRGPYQFFLADGVRAARIDPENGKYQVLYDIQARPRQYVNEVGNITEVAHDGRDRVAKYTYPEGVLELATSDDEEILAYDNRNNVTQLTRVPKAGSGLTNLVIQATWSTLWNKPITITNARGFRTDFVYKTTGNGASLLQTATRPGATGSAPTGTAPFPVYAFTYNNRGQLLTATDPTSLETLNSYDSPTGNLLSTTVDPTGLALVTSFSYDPQGDTTSVTDPRGNVADSTFDANRRKTVTRQHNGVITEDVLAAQRSTYDVLGRIAKEEAGIGFAGTAVSTWQTLRTLTYTPTSQLETETNAALETTSRLYDGVDRLIEITDPFGRRTRFTFDLAGQQLQEIRGYGSADPANFATYTYSPNGQRITVKDANNNLSRLVYDGFDRLCRLYFPVTTLGAGIANTGGLTEPPPLGCTDTSTGDYERYSYNENSSRTSLRKRGGQTFGYDFDNLDRETFKNIPAGTTNDVYTDYDLAGRPEFVHLGGSGATGIDYAYDSAGRLIGETSFGRALTFQLDANGNRTRLTWPDANFIQYDIDALNRVTRVRENGASSGVGVLATYTWSPLSLRTGITRGNTANSTLGFDIASRLSSLAHNPAGTAQDVTFAFSYTPAGQLLNRSHANALYAWTVPTVNRTYVPDGLNRYASVAGVTYTHDANGNLTGDGTRTFAYDVENRLTSVTGGAGLTLAYDPLGRLRQSVSGAITIQFLYDGDRLVGEYNAGGTVLRRYAHGPGIDEPIVWYEGAALTTRNFLHADERGSIVATSNNGGTATPYTYGPYGEPHSWGTVGSLSRFRYTGQIAFPEASLYHYKARVYDPTLGRFLQTDPVGYSSGMNLYEYVHGDPISRIDPSGLDCVANEETKLTTCDVPVTGSRIPRQITFPTPEGLSGRFSVTDILHHAYVRPTLHNRPDKSVQESIADDPTPNPHDKPATIEGTDNDAAPEGFRAVLTWLTPIVGDQPRSPVKSYRFVDPNGNTWTINVTQPGHGLHFGYVLRGSIGNTALSIGEGWAREQTWGVLSEFAINDVWSQQNQRNIDNAK